jgi:hypothetical protein
VRPTAHPERSRRVAFTLAFTLTLAFTRLAHAQAEPAPEDYVPPQKRGLPPEPGPGSSEGLPRLPEAIPRWHLAVAPRMAVRLGDGPPQLPVVGLGGGVQVARALVPLGRVVRFGVGFDFAYDRVYRDERAPASGTQFLSHATFAAVGVFDALVGPGARVRPYLALGGGLSVAAYADPAAQPKAINEVAALGLLHAALGVGVRVWESFELGLHGEVDLTFSDTNVGDPPKPIFQPGLFALALDVGFRF